MTCWTLNKELQRPPSLTHHGAPSSLRQLDGKSSYTTKSSMWLLRASQLYLEKTKWFSWSMSTKLKIELWHNYKWQPLTCGKTQSCVLCLRRQVGEAADLRKLTIQHLDGRWGPLTHLKDSEGQHPLGAPEKEIQDPQVVSGCQCTGPRASLLPLWGM